MGRGPRRVAAAPAAELVPGFEPESPLEEALAADPVLREGWAWGEPREGHPEGPVGEHVGHLLETIDEWAEPEPLRSELRFIALVHDSLKYRVRNLLPKTGDNHHAKRARHYAEAHTSDERLLAVIELHDRPYSIWRRMRRTGRDQDHALDAMLERIPDHDLLMKFVELDGSTEGKHSEPVEWLRGELARR